MEMRYYATASGMAPTAVSWRERLDSNQCPAEWSPVVPILGIGRCLRLCCSTTELLSHIGADGFSICSVAVFPAVIGRHMRITERISGYAGPVEEHTGFEPARSDWKSEMLPLHQRSVCRRLAAFAFKRSDCEPFLSAV